MTISDLASWSVANSRARRCKRWSLYPAEIIDLTVAEMDLPVAEPIMAAVRDAVDRQAFGYPLPGHDSELPAAAAEWLTAQGLAVQPEHVNLISDVIKGMVLGLRHFAPPHTPVVVITPTYSRFLDAVEAAQRQVIEVPMLLGENGYSLDVPEIEKALRQGARTVLLCNPSNPVGRVFNHSELAELSVLVERFGARVISDEVHSPLRYGTKFVPYASVSSAAAEHSITLTSASKAWNIPGLRCAIMVLTNPADQLTWDVLPRASKGGISPLGIEASTAAFKQGQPWLNEAIKLLDVNRLAVGDYLKRAGLGGVMCMPEATYLAWFDLREFGHPDPQRYLMENAGVATTSGDEHGVGGAGFVRVNFATPQSVLLDALERMTSALRRSPTRNSS